MLLDGLSVVEVGDGVAGSATTSFLISLGASVTKFSDVGDGTDEDGESGIEREVSALQRQLLDRGKNFASIEDEVTLSSAVESADIVVVDRVNDGPSSLPLSLDDYLSYVSSHNRRAWVTLSAYGLSGSRRDWIASELTAAAAGGTLTAVLDPRTNAPIKLAGSQSLLSAGQVGALASLHGYDVARRRNTPIHVDLSAQEAVIATGPALRSFQVLFGNFALSGAKRNGSPAGYFTCRDGIIRISAMEQHQWQATIRALGNPLWAEAFVTSADRIQHAGTIDANINEWCAKRSKTECEEILQREGVPATALNSPSELLDSSQFDARHCLESFDLEGHSVKAINRPFILLEGEENPSFVSNSEGLLGLRVAEASHVLAMPLAGSLLGAMGAVVTKLEDPHRLDMYRRRGPYIDDVEGLDRNVFFLGVNHSKRSRLIDMDEDAAGLKEILDTSDVLIENLGTGRARRLGLDYQSLNKDRPTLLALSSTGFGQTGPWSRYRAYAYNVLTTSGLAHLTRTATGEPADIDMAWADLQTGFALATIVAAWAIGPHRRQGASVDFSMVELVASRGNEYLAAASIGLDVAPEDGSNHQFPFAPNGLFPTTGGVGLIALSVATDVQWRALKRVVGSPATLDAPQFDSITGRRTHQGALDDALREITAVFNGEDLASQLQGVGIAASPVLTPDEIILNEDLDDESLFYEVEHPQWGRNRLIGLPWLFFGEGRIVIGSPPELGNVGWTH